MKKQLLFTLAFFVFSIVSSASVLVTNGLTHRHILNSGDTETGFVMLKNIGKKPERVLVYFKDLAVGCDGPHQYVDASTTERSNADWIKVGFKERVLQPGEEFPMRYEINIPRKPVEGSFWSLLMVEILKPIDTTQLEYGVRVSSNVRYAIQLITDIAISEPVDVEFNSVNLTENNGRKLLDVNLNNLGTKLLIPQVKLEVYDESGELVREQKADTKKLYPSQCRSYQVPLEGLPKGQYQGVLVADCGESDLFGMTINLAVDE